MREVAIRAKPELAPPGGAGSPKPVCVRLSITGTVTDVAKSRRTKSQRIRTSDQDVMHILAFSSRPVRVPPSRVHVVNIFCSDRAETHCAYRTRSAHRVVPLSKRQGAALAQQGSGFVRAGEGSSISRDFDELHHVPRRRGLNAYSCGRVCAKARRGATTGRAGTGVSMFSPSQNSTRRASFRFPQFARTELKLAGRMRPGKRSVAFKWRSDTLRRRCARPLSAQNQC